MLDDVEQHLIIGAVVYHHEVRGNAKNEFLVIGVVLDEDDKREDELHVNVERENY